MHPEDSSGTTRKEILRYVAIIALLVAGGLGYGWIDAENRRTAEVRARQERVDLLNVHIVEFLGKAQQLGGEGDPDPAMRDLVSYSRTFIGPKIKPLVLERYGNNAQQVFALADELGDYEKVLKEVEASKRAYDSKLERLKRDEERLAELRRENKQQAFMIQRRFDTNSSGKGLYEAYNATNYRNCVLIADDEAIGGVGTFQQVQLYVKFLGEQPMKVKKYNAFQSFDATEYMPTYTTSDAGNDILQLAQSVSQAKIDMYGSVDPDTNKVQRISIYYGVATKLAEVLDDRYTKFSFAEKADEVRKSIEHHLYFKDGVRQATWSPHGDREYFFNRPGMTVEEAIRYARLMGAKDEHFAKSRKDADAIKYFSPTGGVTIFLEHGKANQVMYWIPEKVMLQKDRM